MASTHTNPTGSSIGSRSTGSRNISRSSSGSKRRPRTVDALLAELCRTLARRTGIDCLDDDVQARIVADVARSSLASERMAAHVLQMSSDDRMAWAVGQLSAALTRAGYYDDADALEDYDRRIQFGLDVPLVAMSWSDDDGHDDDDRVSTLTPASAHVSTPPQYSEHEHGIQQVQAQVLQAQLHNLQQMQQMQQQAHDQQAHNQREHQPQLDDLEHTQQQHRLDSLSLGRLMLTDDDLDGSDCDISSVTEFGVCLNDGCEGGGSAGSSDRRRRQRQRRRRQMWQQQQQAVVAMPDSPRCSSPSEDRSVQPSADHSKLALGGTLLSPSPSAAATSPAPPSLQPQSPSLQPPPSPSTLLRLSQSLHSCIFGPPSPSAASASKPCLSAICRFCKSVASVLDQPVDPQPPSSQRPSMPAPPTGPSRTATSASPTTTTTTTTTASPSTTTSAPPPASQSPTHSSSASFTLRGRSRKSRPSLSLVICSGEASDTGLIGMPELRPLSASTSQSQSQSQSQPLLASSTCQSPGSTHVAPVWSRPMAVASSTARPRVMGMLRSF